IARWRLLHHYAVACSELFVSNREGRFKSTFRAGPDENLEVTWLNHKAVLAVVKGKLLGCEGKFNLPFLVRTQGDSLEALQLSYRSRYTRRQIPDVQLHNFVAGPRSTVLDFDSDLQAVTGSNPRRAEPQVRQLKLRIAQSIA